MVIIFEIEILKVFFKILKKKKKYLNIFLVNIRWIFTWKLCIDIPINRFHNLDDFGQISGNCSFLQQNLRILLDPFGFGENITISITEDITGQKLKSNQKK